MEQILKEIEESLATFDPILDQEKMAKLCHELSLKIDEYREDFHARSIRDHGKLWFKRCTAKLYDGSVIFGVLTCYCPNNSAPLSWNPFKTFRTEQEREQYLLDDWRFGQIYEEWIGPT